MKIVGIFGSMRLGNSDWMISQIIDSAEKAGAQVEKIFLRELKIGYCVGCDKCVKNGECTIDDDMQRIYPKLLNADVIVLGCPNYFKNVSALTKNFMDRTNALVRFERKLKGKYAIGLCVGGEELEDTQHCADALVRFFKGHRMNILTIIKAKADKPREVRSNSDLGKMLVKMGKRLAKGDPEMMNSILWDYSMHGSHSLYF
jgi:multimeric flavodoxin WrbA